MKKTILTFVMVAVMAFTLTGLAQAMTACKAAEEAQLEIVGNLTSGKYKTWKSDQITAEWKQIKAKWKNQITSGTEYDRAMDLYFQWIAQGMKNEQLGDLIQALKQGCPNDFN
jgi:hypothetical protein